MWEAFLQNWAAAAWLLGVPLLLGLIGHFLVFKVIRKIAQRAGSVSADSLVRHCYRPAQWTAVVLVIRVALSWMFADGVPSGISQIVGLFLIGVVSWLLISALWDRKVCVLQVTNTTEHSVELRALMSASDASVAWNLRCEVREKLVEFIRTKYPQALPTVRAELHRLKAGQG